MRVKNFGTAMILQRMDKLATARRVVPFLVFLAMGLTCSMGGLKRHLYGRKPTTSRINVFIHVLLHTRLDCVQPHMCAYDTLCADKERGGGKGNGVSHVRREGDGDRIV
jgi:hypothetical protein